MRWRVRQALLLQEEMRWRVRKRIMKTMIESLSGSACNLEDLDVLQLRLEEELSGKTFLLVLDDLWNENQEEWNRLKCSLMNGAKGGLVVVTTRLKTVASITGTLPPYCLRVLSEDDCLTLFKAHAFGLGNEIRPALVEIGKEIVKKCGGLPLAEKALRGLLRFKSEETEWLAIQKSEIWELPQSGENNILPALRLSYNHLPLLLKQCFVYCSTFPRGKMFCSYRKDGGIEKCKMHDLVHDLACHIAVDECFALDVSLFRMPNLEGWSRSLDTEAAQLFPCLKSLILKECPKLTQIPLSSSQVQSVHMNKCNEMVLESLQNLPCLSPLEIWNFNELECFPKAALQGLTDLKKLDVYSCPKLKTLPAELESLTMLTELKMECCKELVTLPDGLKNLSSLKSLDIRECAVLKCLPELEKSSLIDLRIKDCPELEFSLKDFENLAVLQTLILDGLPKLTCFPEGIKGAVMLQHLAISRCSEDVMDLPEWIGSLRSLQKLWIGGCKNRKFLPEGLQYLTALRTLEIFGCNAELQRGCDKEKGEDWFKISHVPLVVISTSLI